MNQNTFIQEGPSQPIGNNVYDPDALLNQLQARMDITGDSQLARCLSIERRLLGKIRARQVSITGSILMTIQEATGIPVAELKQMLKDRRKTSRMGSSFMQSGLKGNSEHWKCRT